VHAIVWIKHWINDYHMRRCGYKMIKTNTTNGYLVSLL